MNWRLEAVEQVVHVADRHGPGGVAEQVRLARLAEQPRRLLGHPPDQAPDARREDVARTSVVRPCRR
jgi:hypothetical protein